MMMCRPCPSGSRLMKPFFKFKIFFHRSKLKLWISQGKIAEISEFQIWPKIPLKTVHFSIMKKLWDLNKVFSNLALVGWGRGIIMGATRLLLLGPFYYIQTNFLYFFAHHWILLFLYNQNKIKITCKSKWHLYFDFRPYFYSFYVSSFFQKETNCLKFYPSLALYIFEQII